MIPEHCIIWTDKYHYLPLVILNCPSKKLFKIINYLPYTAEKTHLMSRICHSFMVWCGVLRTGFGGPLCAKKSRAIFGPSSAPGVQWDFLIERREEKRREEKEEKRREEKRREEKRREEKRREEKRREEKRREEKRSTTVSVCEIYFLCFSCHKQMGVSANAEFSRSLRCAANFWS